MTRPKISFIGGGNMARSIIGGLTARSFPATAIMVSDPDTGNTESLERDFGINSTHENSIAAEFGQVLVLAVKPQILKDVTGALPEYLQPDTLVVSIAAGITCASLEQWLGKTTAIVRCMPNTPALVQCGASGLYANGNVTSQQREQAANILSAVGTIHWVDEEGLLDAVTAVSGSGPAYFFLMLEAMTDAGEKLGLNRATAAELAVQTAAGAAKLAAASDVDTSELRRRVTSPGGTTERAIAVFEQRDLRGIVETAMTACADRSLELARILGE